ncbi:MAG: TRAP transporter large permease subunit [Desulfuromonas thiophila]|jgi:TRAP-type uncharacterized transport system fused permease subunit|nr:TRAP transporter large permease subunit [Desulfuromonas thiophila]
MPETKDHLEELNPQDQEKLKTLMEKDAKSFRTPSGLWHWVTALLGAFMVLFYFYAAGVKTVGTQYHLGIYVFITYVLVFLLYPAGSARVRVVLSGLLGLLLSGGLTAWLFSPDIASFHARLLAVGDALGEAGLAGGLAALSGFWLTLLLALAVAVAVFFADRFMLARWRQSPCLSDILFALAAGATVFYWISQFEALNYRAGAETELDGLVSVVGILLSMEVCRRVLGWSMTLIGVGMLAFGYFGPHLPDILAHRGFGIERMANALFLTTNGVFGVMANVLATYVILFIFFGAFLQKSGAGRFFIDLPLALAGKSTGGAG